METPLLFRAFMTKTPAVELLVPIWQRVLNRSSVNLEEDFFDVGGNPVLARELFTDISRTCSQEISPLMICEAPTILALAALLEQPTPRQLSPLVLLKPGSEKPPVFMTHGIGGSMVDFFQLARKMETPHPIYGLQAKGLDGVGEAVRSVEEMAEFNLDAIRQVQTRGPYYFIGYSLGGLVMLEMAQRLRKRGEQIGLLVLLDSYPHARFLSRSERLRLVVRRARRRVSVMKQGTSGRGYRAVQLRLRTSPDPHQQERPGPSTGSSLAQAAERVRKKAELAHANYRPRFYDGEIKFVRAAVLSFLPDDPVAIWSRLAAAFETETAPGDHVGMVATHFESLALVISRYLSESFSQAPSAGPEGSK
jgi:acetoacetyl-CoA synthetase